MFEEVRRGHVGGGLGEVGGLVYLSPGRLVDLFVLFPGKSSRRGQLRFENSERVSLSRLFDLLPTPVATVVVVAGVGQIAFHHGLYQCRPVAPPSSAGRLQRRLIDGHDVAPIDRYAGHAVALSAARDAVNRHLPRKGHRYRVSVVLAEEDHGEPVDAREVHRLVTVADAGCAVAEIGYGHRVVVPHPGGQRRAHRLGDLRAYHVRQVYDAVFGVRPVCRELASATERLALLRQEAQHYLLRGDLQRQEHGQVAVVDVELVEALLERPGATYLPRLMSLRRRDDGRVALTVEKPYALVQRPAHHHLPVHIQQSLVIQGMRGPRLAFSYDRHIDATNPS